MTSVDDEELRKHRTVWLQQMHERAVRALRFGADVRDQRQQKREQMYDDPRKRKLRPREFDAASLSPPEPVVRYLEGFRSVFKRRDTLAVAVLYVIGLLSDLPHKNGETMEAAIPGFTQEGAYRLLARGSWSAAELDRLRVLDGLDRAGCRNLPVDAIIDETSFAKKGTDSVGVARQYLGCLGKTDNGQVIVSLHLCAGDFDLPGTAEVFLPEKGWGGSDEACQQRRAAAKVPEDWVLRTKPELAVALLLRVRAWGLTLRRVYADAGYAALGMMLHLAALGLDFVLSLHTNTSVRLCRRALAARRTTTSRHRSSGAAAPRRAFSAAPAHPRGTAGGSGAHPVAGRGVSTGCQRQAAHPQLLRSPRARGQRHQAAAV